jgi:hypothetical protein
MVHKALELLARKKLALQNGESSFSEPELGLTFDTEAFTPDEAAELGYNHYAQKEPHHDWKPADKKTIRNWMYDTMTLNGGMFNPLNRKIIQPEQYFDFELDFDWARYDYALPNGKRLQGKLSIKGTVDLVTEVSPGILEYQDYKSGKRIDWATGEEKDYKKLRDDPQLRIYHYALCKLYPDVKEIVMTIIYIKHGGAFSLPFSREDIPKTEDMLRRRFETIKQCQRPKLNESWRCTKFCHYGKNNYVDAAGKDTGKTICQHFNGELSQLGLERVMAKYADMEALGQYQDGGGRSAASRNKE